MLGLSTHVIQYKETGAIMHNTDQQNGAFTEWQESFVIVVVSVFHARDGTQGPKHAKQALSH